MRTTTLAVIAVSLGLALFHLAACHREEDEDCGPNPCDACRTGCTTDQRCVDGSWQCDCDCPDGGEPDSDLSGDGGCGPSPCGACAEECRPLDRCADGGWVCACDCPASGSGGGG